MANTTADLSKLDIVAASTLLRSKQVSPVELTKAILDRIDALDGRLHAYISLAAERALGRAEEAEREIARGDWRGPLHGVPIALKDLIDTSFLPTSAGMAVLADHTPSLNATVTDRLEAAGAIILGKLSMTEGAYAAHHPEMPKPVNPWSAAHWTGASSSGSGVATAAGLCFASLGSDTGGSIRLPSTACGVTGLKPTWGRVSRAGVFPLAETLDHIGPMARSAADAAIVLEAIAGQDGRDPTSLWAPVPAYSQQLTESIETVRIGIDDRLIADHVSPEVSAATLEAAGVLTGLGAKSISVTLPAPGAMIEAFGPMCACEAAIAHRDLYDRFPGRYGDRLADLVEQGAAMDGRSLAQAHIDRGQYAGKLAALFETADVLILPAMPLVTPEVADIESMSADTMISLARFTIPFDMSGSPTLTLPGGFDSRGMPIGFQLVGRHLSEDLLLRIGHAFQGVTDWHRRWPVA
jgi:amidase